MPICYLPILKGKVGELEAIKHLAPAAKGRILPIIRLLAAIPKNFQQKAAASFEGIPIGLDGEPNVTATSSTETFSEIFKALKDAGISVIPSVRHNSADVYREAAQRIVLAYGGGSIVHVDLVDLPKADAWCANVFGVPPSEADLVIKIGDVSTYDPATLAGYVHSTILDSLAEPKSWRSITLSSFSAAKDNGVYSTGRNLAPRSCWRLWKNVTSMTLPFELNFSDCGHTHPSLEEVPAFAMAKATVSVRYTIDDNWIVIKGRAITGMHGKPMKAQYQSHAEALTKEAEFNNLAGCWGDERISFYAATSGSTGGRKEWVAILLNRHLSHVCERLP